jgi:hypothetical protein
MDEESLESAVIKLVDMLYGAKQETINLRDDIRNLEDRIARVERSKNERR